MSFGRLKTLINDILYYGVANILYTLVQLITMPLVIRNMEMAEVANWNILLLTGIILAAFTTFGMDSAIVRFLIDKDEPQKKIIYSMGLYFVTGLSVILGLTLWVFAEQTSDLINFSSEYLSSYWILICWLPGVILSQYSLNWLKYSFQRSRFVTVIALQSSTYLAVILYLKYFDKINLLSVMLASLASIWISALLGLIFTFKMIVPKIDIYKLGLLLRYGTPFMILAFGFNLIFSIDKYILIRYSSQEYFAIYSQAFRIAAIFSMIVSSFNFAFGPFSLSLLDKEGATESFSYLRTVYLLFISFAGLGFMSISEILIILLAGKSYAEGHIYVPFFVLGYILYGLYSFAQLGIIRSKKSYLSLYVLSFGILVVIGIDILLVPHIKGFGAAIGFVLGNLTMVISANYVSSRYDKDSLNNIKDLFLLFIFICIGFVMSLISVIGNIYFEAVLKLTFCIFIFIFTLSARIPFLETEGKILKQGFAKLMKYKSKNSTSNV